MSSRTLIVGIDPGPTRSAWTALFYEAPGKPISFYATDIVAGNGLRVGSALSRSAIVPGEIGNVLYVIEAVEGYAFAATKHRGGGQAVVRALIETQRVVGELVGYLRVHRQYVATVTAAKARSRVGVRARDAAIKDFVPRFVRAWPKRSNVHARDAAVVAMAGAYTLGVQYRGNIAGLSVHGIID